jgi:hypothetical protein
MTYIIIQLIQKFILPENFCLGIIFTLEFPLDKNINTIYVSENQEGFASNPVDFLEILNEGNFL